MPSLMNRLVTFARSPQGRRFVSQATTYARSPEGRARIDRVRRQIAARDAGRRR
jgi:hypothetical protein